METRRDAKAWFPGALSLAAIHEPKKQDTIQPTGNFSLHELHAFSVHD
jgi:hypothetical protein